MHNRMESNGASLFTFLLLVALSLVATVAVVVVLYRRGRGVPPPDLQRTLPHHRA
jgi:hypothetical protein